MDKNYFSMLETLDELIVVSNRVLPKLDELEKAGAILEGDRALFRRMISSYLPEATRGFLRLTIKVARKSRIDGSSPSELYLEQLKDNEFIITIFWTRRFGSLIISTIIKS